MLRRWPDSVRSTLVANRSLTSRRPSRRTTDAGGQPPTATQSTATTSPSRTTSWPNDDARRSGVVEANVRWTPCVTSLSCTTCVSFSCCIPAARHTASAQLYTERRSVTHVKNNEQQCRHALCRRAPAVRLVIRTCSLHYACIARIIFARFLRPVTLILICYWTYCKLADRLQADSPGNVHANFGYCAFFGFELGARTGQTGERAGLAMRPIRIITLQVRKPHLWIF